MRRTRAEQMIRQTHPSREEPAAVPGFWMFGLEKGKEMELVVHIKTTDRVVIRVSGVNPPRCPVTVGLIDICRDTVP